MLNQVVLVGRLYEEPKLKVEGEKTFCNIIVAVPRIFKNKEGEYETDFISCLLVENIAKSSTKFLKKGDTIGIKGRLQSDNNNKLELIAEKMTFLSCDKEEKEEH